MDALIVSNSVENGQVVLEKKVEKFTTNNGQIWIRKAKKQTKI